MARLYSIRAKFLFAFILIGACYIIISSLFILNVMDSYVNSLTKKNFISRANDFESMAEPNFIYFNYMNLSSQVEEILRGNTSDFIMLFDSKGQEIVYKGPDHVKDQLGTVEFPAEMTFGELSLQTLPYYLVTLPVKVANDNTIWGYIVFGFSLQENNRLITRIYLYILVFSLISLLLAAVAIAIWTRKLTRPVETLKKGQERISNGDFSYRIQIKTNDEFAYLGRQFNEMGEKIENMMHEIESSHKDLEKQVRERTRELNESNQKLQEAMKELKDTQMHIIQTEKQKSLTAIVTGFAHEINNPMTGIMGYVDLLIMRDDVSPYIKDKLVNIQKQTQRIKTIIDQLSQLEPGVEQSRLDINLLNLLDKLIKVTLTKPECRDIVIEKDYRPEEVIVHGNHFALWQVFDGVIENSVEAIHTNNIPEGKIVVSFKKSLDGRQAVVEISDNGGGFHNLEKAFDPFYTTKSRTRKKGIGLSIAYNIIQEHEGNIIIANNDRAGSTVTIYLKIHRT